jgi:hypothetical protein
MKIPSPYEEMSRPTSKSMEHRIQMREGFIWVLPAKALALA